LSAVLTAELFGEGAGRGCVLESDFDEAVGEFQDGVEVFVELAAFFEGSRFGGGVDGFPEREVEIGDCEGVDGAPLLDGGVELLCYC
jgi:hypothetical protein